MGESERLDELYKYFPTPSAVSYDNHGVNLKIAPSGATMSSDPVLNALTQLGAVRLGTERAFVSLIDHQNQYVVAEATCNGSLVDATHEPDGLGIAVGVQTLDLVSGICASTIPVFTDTTGETKVSNGNMFADTTRFIVNDLALEPKFSNRSCVTGFPYMRFYAAAAIRSSAGHVIGNFAAIDSRPHPGLTADGQRALVEIAASVMKHLELLKIQKSHDSALKLLHGLESFVRHEASVEPNEAAATKVNSLEKSSSPPGKKPPISESNNSLAQHIAPNLGKPNQGEGQRLQNHDHVSPSESNPHSPPISQLVRSVQAETSDKHDLTSPPKASSNKVDTSETRCPSNPPDQHQDVLTRASSLIRAAMHMDRVFFIKAPTPASLSKSRNGSSSTKILDTAELSAEVQRRVAAESGLSVDTQGPGKGDAKGESQDDLTISDELHQGLLSQHPRGAFFNFTNYPRPEADDSDAKAALFRSLRSSLPPARSLLFQPLFGPDNKTSLRSMFAWSSGEKRVLQEEDLNYFRLFSAAIEAKFSQIETAIQSRAKSDFISSISHELRSPLHGILGNAELLTHSRLDADQEESIQMIQKSGGALLTTLDHVLTYSKINTRTRVQSLSPNLSSEKDAVTSSIDLSMVVEDSVDTLISGNHFRKLAANRDSFAHSKSDSQINLIREESNGTKRGPMINLTIDPAPTWFVITEEAVWVRSVINILGNAMKYTESGAIEVRLQMRTPKGSNTEKQTHTVKLSVSDTGRGMSSTYLQNHLYHAFSQENSTSDGLGLGLSIVKKLVEGLDGSIDIQSTVGEGTLVEISAPIIVASKDHTKEQSALRFQGKTICLLGQLNQQHIDPQHNSVAIPHQHEVVSMESTLSKYCKQWYGMEVSHSATAKDVATDVMVILEEDLHLLKDEAAKIQDGRKQAPACGIIVISTNSDTGQRIVASKIDGMFYILPPFGPRRLSSILRQALRHTRKTNEAISAPLSRPVSNATSIPERHKSSTSSSVGSGQTQSTPHSIYGTSAGTYVLVVDDNEINVKLLSKSLTKWQIPYETASNGSEAVATFQNSGKIFDYILMDISMPVMNGIAATRAIRELETARQSLPRAQIIAMTGLGDEKTQQEAIASGMDLFMTKPIRLGQIKSLLQLS